MEGRATLIVDTSMMAIKEPVMTTLKIAHLDVVVVVAMVFVNYFPYIKFGL